MKKVLTTVLASTLFCLLLAGCSSSGSEIRMPFGAGDVQGKNYEELVSQLKSAGFTNVKAVGEQDLVIGFLHDDGEVDKVEIKDGDTTRDSFSTDSKFEPDTEITVFYHSYPQNTDGNSSDDGSNENYPTEGRSSETEAATQEAESAGSAEPEVLSVDSCPELATLLSLSDPCSPTVSSFAASYKDKTIEFDAYIADMQHGGG